MTAIKVLALVLAVAILSACSREKIDWKSAEAADTVEGYDHFIERHPESELTTQARARVAQLNEDRDWKRVSALDTADAYRQFLGQHESGKWAAEARIRIENFALDGTATGPARPIAESEPDTREPATPSAPPAVTPVAPEPAPPPVVRKPAAVAAATARAAATTPAGQPAAATATAQPAQFGIQLGAFRSQEAALTDWKRLLGKFDSDLHGLFARAVPVQQSGGPLFRLQAPVGDEARARAICASLSKQSQPCVVVLPQSH